MRSHISRIGRKGEDNMRNSSFHIEKIRKKINEMWLKGFISEREGEKDISASERIECQRVMKGP